MNKETILSKPRKITAVEGTDFFIRHLSQKEFLEFSKNHKIPEEQAKDEMANLVQSAKLCCLCLCDAVGKLIFTIEDFKALLETDLPLLQLANTIVGLLGFNALEKKES